MLLDYLTNASIKQMLLGCMKADSIDIIVTWIYDR